MKLHGCFDCSGGKCLEAGAYCIMHLSNCFNKFLEPYCTQSLGLELCHLAGCVHSMPVAGRADCSAQQASGCPRVLFPDTGQQHLRIWLQN